jgi:hypothetical protein
MVTVADDASEAFITPLQPSPTLRVAPAFAEAPTHQENRMSRNPPSVLKPVPAPHAARQPVRAAAPTGLGCAPRASGLQLSFQFHRLP